MTSSQTSIPLLLSEGSGANINMAAVGEVTRGSRFASLVYMHGLGRSRPGWYTQQDLQEAHMCYIWTSIHHMGTVTERVKELWGYHGRPQLLWKGSRIGQGGHHSTAVNKLSAFGRFNERGGGGGGGGGEVLCAFNRFNHSISGVGKLSAFSAHVCKLLLQGGGPWPP